ncbi:MAG: hypothetical protein V7693_15800 [Halopseudomonas sabulinigri]
MIISFDRWILCDCRSILLLVAGNITVRWLLAKHSFEAVAELVPLSVEEFKQLLIDRGWDAGQLSIRWGLTRRRLDQLINDADRPRYYDDAVRSLPVLPGAAQTLPDDLTQSELAIIKKLRKEPISMVENKNGWSPTSYLRGTARNDYLQLIERTPRLVTLKKGFLQLV